MNSDSSSTPPRRLEVDLIFLERTFRSRAKTQELLGPEREAGTINPGDYEAAIRYTSQVRVWPYILTVL